MMKFSTHGQMMNSARTANALNLRRIRAEKFLLQNTIALMKNSSER
jgi:hypothetical protein